MLGMVALKMGNYRQAYGNFIKTVELSLEHNDAQAQIGSLLLLSRESTRAEEKGQAGP